MIRLGAALIILSILVLVVSLVVPGALAPLAPLYCEPGERLTGEVTSVGSLRRTTVGTTYACVDSFGERRSVTENVSVSATIAFVAMLFAGMALVGAGAARAPSRRADIRANPREKRKNDDGEIPLPTPPDSQVGVPAGIVVVHSALTAMLDDLSGSVAQGRRTPLADVLRQLEDARAQGLITVDEYQKLRQEALDKLV